ncbi:hypothetical protein SAMN04488557_1060 [Hyphomicrobium facile]|uniref:Uncharacterized protein n=1 Tax=Hyphomicrobium facile TaxID=51670 RepID=A0A1I7N1V9_9HYPH|nr:hypothetical protein SAMN04488557_1060 [Hyphomicrobium facile]
MRDVRVQARRGDSNLPAPIFPEAVQRLKIQKAMVMRRRASRIPLPAGTFVQMRWLPLNDGSRVSRAIRHRPI